MSSLHINLVHAFICKESYVKYYMYLITELEKHSNYQVLIFQGRNAEIFTSSIGIYALNSKKITEIEWITKVLSTAYKTLVLSF